MGDQDRARTVNRSASWSVETRRELRGRSSEALLENRSRGRQIVESFASLADLDAWLRIKKKQRTERQTRKKLLTGFESLVEAEMNRSPTRDPDSLLPKPETNFQPAVFQAIHLLQDCHQDLGGESRSIASDSPQLNQALELLSKAILQAPEDQLARCHALRGYVHLLRLDFARTLDDCTEALRLSGGDTNDLEARLGEDFQLASSAGAGELARMSSGVGGNFDGQNKASFTPYWHRNRWQTEHAEPLIWRSCAAAARREWLAAVVDLDHALVADPGRRQEVESLRQRFTSEGIAWFQSQAAAGQITEDLFVSRGQLYQRIGEDARAIRDFQSALELHPENLEARFWLARIQASVGDFDLALRQLRGLSAMANEPRFQQALMLRARIHAACGNLNAATTDLQELKNSFSDDEYLRLVAAKFLRQIGLAAEAVEDLNWLLRRNRKGIEAREERASLYIELRNDELAIRDLHELLKLEVPEPHWYLWRGNAYLRQRRWEEAEQDFIAALEIDELCTEAYVGLAEVASGKSQRSQSLSYCDRALRLDSRCERAHLRRAKWLIESGKAKGAQEGLSRVIELSSSNEVRGQAHYLRGTVESYLKQDLEALEDFDAGLNYRAMHPGTLIWRSNVYRGQKNWMRAMDDLELAMKVNPVAMPMYQRLGEEIGRLALEWSGQRLLTGENRAACHHLMGRGKRLLGNLEEAQQDLARAHELAPDAFEIVRNLSGVLEQQGKFDDAIAVLTRFVDEARSGMVIQYSESLLKNELHEKDPIAKGSSGEASRLEHADQALPKKQSTDDSDSSSAHQEQVLAMVFVERARLFAGRNQPKMSLADLERAIKLAPDCFAARLARGEHRLRTQHFESAISDLSLALDRLPGNHLALAHRGRARYLNNQFLEAIQDFSFALDRFGDQPAVLAARGHAYLKNHQAEEAEKDFDAALAINASELDAFTGKAIVLAKQGETEASLIWITKAVHRFEKPAAWAPLLMTRGRIFYNSSRFKRAISDYSLVIDWDVNTTETVAAIYARGVARLQDGDAPGARVDFEAALAREPRFQPASLALDWMDGRVRERPKALLVPKRTVRPTRPRITNKPHESLSETENWEAEAPFDQWVVRTEEMIEFGPCPKAIVDQWCLEGRISPETRLLRADWSAWKRAIQVYPCLGEPVDESGQAPVLKESHSDSSTPRLGNSVEQSSANGGDPATQQTQTETIEGTLGAEDGATSVAAKVLDAELVDVTEMPKSHHDEAELNEQRYEHPERDS